MDQNENYIELVKRAKLGDEKSLEETYGLTRLAKDEVFLGGYWSKEDIGDASPNAP